MDSGVWKEGGKEGRKEGIRKGKDGQGPTNGDHAERERETRFLRRYCSPLFSMPHLEKPHTQKRSYYRGVVFSFDMTNGVKLSYY